MSHARYVCVSVSVCVYVCFGQIKCLEYEVEGPRPKEDRPKGTWSEVVERTVRYIN